MRKMLLATAAAAATLLGTSAYADTASGGTIGTTGATDYSGMLGYLSLFNPAAGTLTGVSFTVGYGFNSTIQVSGTTDSSGAVYTKSAANFDTSNAAVKGVFDSLINNKPDAQIGSSTLSETAYDLNGNASSYRIAAGQTSNFSSVASASTTYSVALSDISKFNATQSSAVFDVYGRTLTGLIFSASSGNAQASQSTVASQTISVAYTYTPVGAVTPAVPEPATWAMMLIGFGMVGAVARYRRKGASAYSA